MAPPSFYDQTEDVDPDYMQQMQMTSLYLAQRQQQLQQQLASLTAQAGGMSLNTNVQRNAYQQSPMTPQTPQSYYGQQQVQGPIEVPGQPGVYLVYNPAIQGYSYAYDQSVQQQGQQTRNTMSPVQQTQMRSFSASPPVFEPNTPSVNVPPPPTEKLRSFTPPKKAPSPPAEVEQVEPLPPPSATAFRRGHKKANSLAIGAYSGLEGPKTASAAVFGSQRQVFPPTPATGTFGPGAARNGEHPIRQPRGPPPLDELKSAPTTKYEGSKNFATRQRRRALDSLMKAGTQRRGVSRSPGGSPVSEGEYDYPASQEADHGSRKMSPIGSEMKEKRGSSGSGDGYFGLSSASSSEGEDTGMFKQPPTPATPVSVGLGGERKKMMLGVLSAAEKRRSFIL